ncbi:MAG: ketopantoate reductase family protein [Clostridia bacterium]|nr:ketopantoate reductase family protein [Clostridia bacterium]
MDRIAIIGMGALGLLYGDMLQAAFDVGFIVGARRKAEYAESPITVNGVGKRFDLLDAGAKDPVDLLVFAVKGTALEGAVEDAAGYVGDGTIIISLLNGITSEDIIGKRFGADHLVWCTAQGMDAVRTGRSLTYTQKGTLRLGLPGGGTSPNLEKLCEMFDRASVPYAVEDDILHRQWSKFMLNVGVNQVLMVHEGNYGTIQRPGPVRDQMIAAMREVIPLSEREGVPVTEADVQDYLRLMDTLSPEGMPSMRQDGLARRKSEVELFSGTVCRLADKHGLPAPVNRWLYDTIRAREAGYDKGE